ncbi:MAG: hypothetical protein JST00_41375 [Deltaproteobacteria bacterium]|nr:hypothetical protein [Deltaproteobacteria bacterium]
MQFAARAPLLIAALAVAVVGCAQKKAQPLAKSAAPTATVAPPPAQADETQPDNVKRPRLGEAGVYVDGKSVGVLSPLELPANVKSHKVKLGFQGEYEVTRWSFKEYAKSLGLDPAKLQAVHLYGGSRVVVIDGPEFARISEELTFSFSQGDRGKPRVHWPAMKFHVNTTIDQLTAVTFYAQKTPPHLVEGELVMPDGTKVEGKVPYADNEQGHGTRVYVDGALVGVVKRKKLTNDIALPGKSDGPTKFSLGDYAAKLGADPKNVKAIDLIAGDDVIAHVSPANAKSLAFHVPARNQGQILVDVPVGQAPEEKRAARVSAVQIFVKTAPPARTITSLDDAPAAAPAGSGGGNGGGNSDDE